MLSKKLLFNLFNFSLFHVFSIFATEENVCRTSHASVHTSHKRFWTILTIFHFLKQDRYWRSSIILKNDRRPVEIPEIFAWKTFSSIPQKYNLPVGFKTGLRFFIDLWRDQSLSWSTQHKASITRLKSLQNDNFWITTYCIFVPVQYKFSFSRPCLTLESIPF